LGGSIFILTLFQFRKRRLNKTLQHRTIKNA
jgi:hypothetical protein